MSGMSSFATPIAICGMGMRLPGGVRDADSFWKFVSNKNSGRCRIPKDRYNVDAFHGPGKVGHVASEYGYFIDDVNLGQADVSFWSMTKEEIATMDPQQRLALEVTYEALQTAGQPPEALSSRRIGVYVGTFEGDWQEITNGRDTQNHLMYQITGSGDYMPANRISREFNFTGPSVTTRTACSSSLTALHEACRALSMDECEAAVVVGSNIIISPRTTVVMGEQGLLSPTGFCRTFDARADGYVRGEAVSALYIKRLSDARRDGNPVRSIVRSTAVNASGRSPSVTTPSSEAIEALVRRVHDLAGVTTLARTAMIECHGTGTAVGDPIEARAIANLFGRWGIHIGSVKPNFGHSEGASGLTSIIKMTLALENRTIPPNINFQVPNPKIPFDEAKLTVPTEPEPWPVGRDELVVVNSFGLGGSNCSVLLSSAKDDELSRLYPPTRHKACPESEHSSATRLLLFSARHPDALGRAVQDHESYLTSHPDSLRDMSFSLAAKRDHLPCRAFCVTDGLEDLVPTLAHRPVLHDKGPPKKMVFVFTGQGAQWAGMGQPLYRNAPEYREALESLDAFLQTLPDGPSWSLVGELNALGEKSRLAEAEVSQPCCTAVQVGLVTLLSRRYGIRPSVVVGHSSGEIAAAFAAGLITANEAILVAYYRGKAVAQAASASTRGAMAAVGLGPGTVTPFLRPGVVVGCENSPASTTITGDSEAVKGVMRAVKKEHPEALVRQLKVDNAYHSCHMEIVAAVYRGYIKGKISPVDCVTPFVSSVTGNTISEGQVVGPEYWVRNLVSPVRFSTAMANIVESWGARKVFLELGPHPALAGPIRQNLAHSRARDDDYVGTLSRGSDSNVDVLKMVGTLWLQGVSLAYGDIMGPGRFLPDLPLYPWRYEESFWRESRLSREYRLRRFPHHDLLGSRVIETPDESPAWRNVLRADSLDWMPECESRTSTVFPATGHVCMAGEAVRQVTDPGRHDFSVRKLRVKRALRLHRGTHVELTTQLWHGAINGAKNSRWYDFVVSSVDQSGDWVTHATGQVRSGSEFPSSMTVDTEALPRRISPKEWNGGLGSRGLPCDRGIARLADVSAHTTERRAVANIINDVRQGESIYAIHPRIIHCLIQTLSVAYVNGLTKRLGSTAVPTYIGEISLRRAKPQGRIDIAASWATKPASKILSNTVNAFCDGPVVARLEDVRFSSYDVEDASPEADQGRDRHAAAALVWREDLDLIDASGLMRVVQDRTDVHRTLDLFASACIVEAAKQTRNLTPVHAHHRQFATWMQTLSGDIRQGLYPGVKAADLHLILEDSERQSVLRDLRPFLAKSVAAPAAEAVWRITSFCCEILTAQKDVLELLFQGGLLHQLYNFMSNTDCSMFVDLLAHQRPGLRVLEIGAGTGGTTATILPALHSKETGQRMYGSYVYTDVSSGFFHTARERFKDYAGMEFAVLDISSEPGLQGFDGKSFDLVVACNVLHATPSLRETLVNVRKLLRPDGRLLLQELSPVTKWINFVAGVLPGWWLGASDSRPTEPYVSAERWNKELRSAGFDGIETLAYDGYLNNNIVAMPKATYHQPKRITLLLRDSKSRSGGLDCRWDIMQRLEQAGYQIDRYGLDEAFQKELPAEQDVLSTLDLTSPFFSDLDENLFATWQRFVSRTRDAGIGLIWPTRASGSGYGGSPGGPEYGIILGLSRVLATEMNIDFATVEIDHLDKPSVDCTLRVLQSFQRQRQMKEEEEADRLTLEWRIVDGKVLIGRYYPLDVTRGLRAAPEHSTPRKLVRCRTESAERFHWTEAKSPPLGPGDVEVAVEAIRSSFDIQEPGQLLTSYIARDEADVADEFMVDASGIVTKVGHHVPPAVLGQRVACCTSGYLTTTLRVPAELVVKFADNLSFAQAASMPAAYITAIYCLIDKARIQAGMSILIHTVPSDISFAAIQIARMNGCKIYCAVSREEDDSDLTKTFGIPREHVLSCPDSSISAELLAEKATKGLSVDVILTSCQGVPGLLQASLQCVAEFGTLVHIHTRSLVDQDVPAVELPHDNRSIVNFDLRHTITQRPEILSSLLQRVMKLYEQGCIGPLLHRQTVVAAELPDRLRSPGSKGDLAEVVILMPAEAQELAIEPVIRLPQMRPDRAYLLGGDIGICGRALATWLVERGAKHIVILSSPGNSATDHQSLGLELTSMGCTLTWVSGDGTRDADVVRAMRSVNMPFAGVIQVPIVPKAAKRFEDLSWDEWQGATKAKTECVWNLHRVFQREQPEPLDIFLLLGSARTIVGETCLGSAAAVDAFLNSFVSYRHSLGLAASCLSVDVSEDGPLRDEPELWDGVDATVGPHAQRTQLVLGPWAGGTPAGPRADSAWTVDQRFLPLRILTGTASTSGGSALSSAAAAAATTPDTELCQFLESLHTNTGLLRSDYASNLLAREMGRALLGLMARPEEDVDVDAPLTTLGMDSLVGLEMRDWIRHNMRVDLAVQDIVDARSIKQLGAAVQTKIGNRLEGLKAL